jgi:hypothetical protein
MKSTIVLLILVLPGFITCQTETVVQPSTNACKTKRVEDASTISILFVGNSLTYSNGLPALIETIGKKNNKSIKTEMLALPNYALEDHWMDGKVQDLICQGNFDFVVAQQGPSSQTLGRGMLLEYGLKLKEVSDSRGSKLAFFMVWPAIANYHTFDGVIANYTDAAKETLSILCPVRTKWKEYIALNKDYSYYSSDGFHPSLKGSEAAAEVIYKTLISK